MQARLENDQNEIVDSLLVTFDRKASVQLKKSNLYRIYSNIHC